MRSWLPRTAFDHPVSVLMMFVALLVIGSIAYVRIPVQMMPSGFEPGWLWMWVPYPNASPLEVDEQLVRPIEDQLSTVSGIRQLRSHAGSGSADFGIEFHASVDMDEAYNTVVDRIERAMPDLPDDVERYWVYRYNPNDSPIIWAGVELPEDMEDPYHVMTRIVQPRLERIPGVASLDVFGVPQKAVFIDYDKERVYAHGIDLGDVQRRLMTDNFQLASGQIEERGLIRHVRGLARIDRVEQLERYPLKEGIALGDVADVRLRQAYSTNIHRINGKEAAGISLRKESGANTVEVGEAVTAALKELEADRRVQGAKFFVFFSQGDLITDSVGTLLDTAMVGGLFAVVILFAFLREWRMTLLIAGSIPFSLLITVGVQYFRGESLNLLSLMGLMLAVGMVVDNAIVVVETIYRRRADGAAPRAAAIGGTSEVNLAILASTATTMVVFLPVILMSENAQFSFFMGALGLPVVFALAASLVVALVFAPLATRYIGQAQVRPDPRWLVWLTERYVRVVRWVLGHRVDATMALVAVGMLTMGVAVPGVDCVSEADENLNDFTIRFTVPPQADPYQRSDIVRRFEEVVEEHSEAWGVRVYRSRLSEDSFRGRLYVYLVQDGPMERDAVMEAATEALPDDIPGVVGTVGWESGQGGGNRHQLELSVHGEDMDTLIGLADEVRRRVSTVDGVMGAHVDMENEGADEVRLVADRDALVRYGVTATQVGRLVSYAMRGSTLPSLLDGEKEIPVASRFSLEDRSDLDAVLDYDVWSPATMSLVPVRALTDIEFGKGPSRIRRRDRRTSTTLTVDLAEDEVGEEVFEGIAASLEDMAFPRGYGYDRGSSRSRQEEEDAAMASALLLSISFVFLLIGILFESFVLPLSIITTIPMAMAGAMWGLYFMGTPLDSMGGVGLVILVGVVVNNGIVLVDLVTQLRADGMERTEAIVDAGRRRLRPILMTALTTICGLLPMALGTSSFIGIPYAPLGRTVICGLVAATVLTLLFVPYLYCVLDDLRVGARRWLQTVRESS